MTTKKISSTVKEHFNVPSENCHIIRLENHSRFQATFEGLEYIIHCLKNKEIKINTGDGENKAHTAHCLESDRNSIDNEPRKSHKKKSGRPRKHQEHQNPEENSEVVKLDDSTSSTRSQRAAAQAAGQKLAQVQSFMKATKLRRPTDFDERQSKRGNVSSPPTKSRKTNRKQSAGSSPSQDADETNDAENKENKVIKKIETYVNDDDMEEIYTTEGKNAHLRNGCSVRMEQLTKSAIKSYTRSRSSVRPSHKRKSSDLFNDSSPLADTENKVKNEPSQATQNDVFLNSSSIKSSRKTHNKKGKSVKLVKSVEDLQQLRQADTQSLPNHCASPLTEGQFKGFDLQNDIVNIKQNMKILRGNIFEKEFHSDSEVVELRRNEVEQKIMRKTVFASKKENVTEVEQIEVVTKTLKTTVLRKKGNQDEIKEIGLNDIGVSNKDISGSKVHKKMSSKENIRESIEYDTRSDQMQEPQSSSVENGIKTMKEVNNENSDSECESPEVENRFRTKVIRKNDNIEVPEDGCLSRTITLKEGTQCNNVNSEFVSKSIAKKSKGLILNEKNKMLTTEASKSPVPNKGELVKKRVEDFEKMTSVVEKVEEGVTGRITRHTTRNKIAPSSESQSSRVNPNVKVVGSVYKSKVPSSTERARLTPLGSQNRMTPAFDSRLLVVNKGLSSATRPTETENSTVLVKKQAPEEIEKKRKEEERLKRQTKEETANKKKEKKLKAAAEEARRKREEKLQKVAATRDAADREKQLLAVKAEKEKEEKMQQMATEKEKQREEQLKKKQLMQQKALEHEERRRQEEAARLAKLREQEEEHKRILAMKEREIELQKQQKAAELRLAEAEKAKYQGGKVGKLAAVNHANAKLQQGVAPASQPPSQGQSYEITPAREDRPLLEPKSENDYGIDEANSGDSSDDETQPKKKIPLWAQTKNRHPLLVVNSLLPKEIWPSFMEGDRHPDISKIFAGNPVKKRTRTSSAVWNTPPSFKF